MKKIKMFRIKSVVMVIAVLIILAVGGTLAYLQASTNFVTNAFTSGVVNVSLEEDFEGGIITTEGVRKSVVVCNDDKDGQLNVVPVYVRVNLVASWVNDDDSSTVAAIDADSLVDYDFVSDKWVLGQDGYYYYNQVLNPNEKTEVLIDSVCLKEGVSVPESGHLEINVLTDAVRVNEVNKDWNSPVSMSGNNIY